jgi:hypothetical protein
MSQRNVERVLGKLITDEEFLGRFLESPQRTLSDLAAAGWELTSVEVAALAALDRGTLRSLPSRIDPRIRRASLRKQGAESNEEDSV